MKNIFNRFKLRSIAFKEKISQLKKPDKLKFSLVISITLLIIFVIKCNNSTRKTIKVGLVLTTKEVKVHEGTEVKKKKCYDLATRLMLERYISEFNEENKKYKIELAEENIKYINYNNYHESQNFYKNLDADVDIIFDNTWGDHLKTSSEIISNNNIPVISLNADKGNVQYDNNVIFLGYDDKALDVLFNFSKEMLNSSEVIFINESNWDLNNMSNVNQVLSTYGIKVSKKIDLSGKDFNITEFEKLELDLKDFFEQNPNNLNIPIIISTHKNWGSEILKALDNYDTLQVLGMPSIISYGTSVSFGLENNNYLVVPISPAHDAIPTEIYEKQRMLFKTLNENYNISIAESDILSPLVIKRCKDGFSIFETIVNDLSSNNIIIDKENILNYFDKRIANKKIATNFDDYEFDKNMLLKKTPSFVKIKGYERFSYIYQINERGEKIPNLIFGITNINLFDVNVEDNSFSVNLNFWIESPNGFKNPESHIIFHNKYPGENNLNPQLQNVENIDATSKRSHYNVSGKFVSVYDLTRFPFEEHTLSIDIQPQNIEKENIKISFDKNSLNYFISHNQIKTLKGWNIDTSGINISYSKIGNDPKKSYKTLRLSIVTSIKRIWFDSFLVIILPVILITLVTISLLFVKDISFNNLGEVIVGTFLGITTYSIALFSIMPHSQELTRAELLFSFSFLICLICFYTVIYLNSKYDQKELKNYNIKYLRLFILTSYIVLTLYILMLYPVFLYQ